MSDKNQEQKIEDLIAFLDGRMAGGGGAVKPKFEDGKMVTEEPKLFGDGLDEDCPTCAKIPNLMQFTPDNERIRERDEEEDW